MSFKQNVTPNLDPVVYQGGGILRDWRGWCLATVETSFGSARSGATAWDEWTRFVNNRHEDRNFPQNVYFPIWFSGAGGAGHVAIAFVNGDGVINIWTSPWEHKPYYDTYPSIEKLESDYRIAYAGWSEDIGGVQVIERVADPAPPPPAPDPVPVVPAPTPPAPNIVYTKLDTPLNLVANKAPTHIWDLGFADDAHANSLDLMQDGTPFTAYGRAQRTDGDKPAYFMSQADFGDADSSGIPARNAGVNTVDLSPAPPPPPAPAAPAPVLEGEQVKVNVIPTDPNAWKSSYTRGLSPVPYTANQNATIKDMDGLDPDAQLVKGQKVMVAGTFEKDGKKYYRTTHSAATNAWYGLPEKTLTRQADITIDSFLDKTLREAPSLKLEAGIYNGRQKAIATAASLDGFLNRLIHRKNNK